MTGLQLVFAEIFGRPVNFLLALAAVTVAATLFVGGPTLIDAYITKTNHDMAVFQEESDQILAEFQTESDRILGRLDDQTRKIMRDIGINLRIVHKDTQMGDLHTDFKAVTFPEEYVHKLANAEKIETIVHLIATLQHKMKWQDRTVLLVGIDPVLTDSQKNAEKKHMMKRVEPGTVVVGHELGIGLKTGDTIEIEGHEFTIASIQPEQGTRADVQLMLDLPDAQEVTGMPGKINQIMALNCKCKGDRISVIRSELEGVLPDTKVSELRGIAEAREQQRNEAAQTRTTQLAEVSKTRQEQLELDQKLRSDQMSSMKLLAGVVVPLVVFACVAFVSLQTWLNVRERRVEIGVLRALGKSTVEIATLFLFKAFALGALGGLVGCGLGYLIAVIIGQQTLGLPPEFFHADRLLIALSIIGAPLLAAMAAYLPTLKAILQDPSVVLMDH